LHSLGVTADSQISAWGMDAVGGTAA